MKFEEMLTLFDSYWFEHHLFSQISPHNEQVVQVEPKLSKTPTFIIRSQSDQCLSSKDGSISEKSDAPSPISVLVEPKLKPILSGKEYNECEFSAPAEKSKQGYRRKLKKKKNSSKSLSELEFEELKGFMDLGFEFSDKDKDSSLVTILPGLRRLGRENTLEFEESSVSRPHLSEAWDVLEEKRKMEKNKLKSWKINPKFGTEIEMKDQLRFWAHTVASAVR